MPDSTEVKKHKNNELRYRSAFNSFLFTVASLLGLIALYCYKSDLHPLAYDCGKTIVLAIFGISIVKIYWDMSEKIKFADYVVSICNISENIHKSGIISIQHSFGDIDWNEFYKNATEIDLALYHGRQTLDDSKKYIVKALNKKNPPSIRIKIPNYKDTDLMEQIANHEPDSSPDILSKDIQHSISILNMISKDIPNSNIRIFLAKDMFPFSIYKTNEKSLVLLSKNPSPMKGDPVIIECTNDGAFYNYIVNHFDNICEYSEIYEEVIN
jgi:hypothetical protein